MPVPGLECCPRCDYDLHGLPENHRCPECGLAYDAASRVWRPTPPLAIIPGLVVFGLALLVCVLAAAKRIAFMRATLFAAAVWLVLVTLAALWTWRVRRRRCLIAALPGGLLVRTRDCMLIPWNELTLLVDDHGEVRVERSGSGESVGLTSFFSNKLHARSFADTVTVIRERRMQDWQ